MNCALKSPPLSPYLTETKVVEAEREKAQAVLVVGFRGTDVFDPDRYALELIDEASSDLASRFFIRIREQMGLAYYVGASARSKPFLLVCLLSISAPIRKKSSS